MRHTVPLRRPMGCEMAYLHTSSRAHNYAPSPQGDTWLPVRCQAYTACCISAMLSKLFKASVHEHLDVCVHERTHHSMRQRALS